MRLIDREALCQDLLDRWNVADEKEEEEIQNVMADVVTPIVFSQPTIELPSWIPCSERLPETEEDFLCIDADENYEVGCYSSNFKHFFFNSCTLIGKPIAWMPLPEPYKEQTERSE